MGDARGAEDVGGVHTFPQVKARFANIFEAERATGVVDQYVEGIPDGLREAGHVVGLGDVAGECDAVDFLGQGFDPLGPPGHTHHLVAVLREQPRGCGADA